MSNLLKSKILLGVMIVAFVFVGAIVKVSAADCTVVGVPTLMVGSHGADVMCLQEKVGATADGSFGPNTLTLVKAFQTANALMVDGKVGPRTAAILNGVVSGGTFPAGCTSALGFSTTTGLSCAATALPAGCTSTTGFSSTTGAKCDGTTGGGVVTGGAGDSDIAHYSTGEKSLILEGEENVNVLGFKIEAIDSDVGISFVKVELSNTNYNDASDPSSEKISNYIDSVDIYKGTTKVGSADLADFAKETKTGADIYSKNIAISDSVVKEGNKDPFYVKFNAAGSIDSDDMAAELLTEVVSYRFEDGTGLTTTLPVSSISNVVSLTDSGHYDSVSLKSFSPTLVDKTLTVDTTNTTDKELALKFKLDVADDSSDVKINELPIVLTITGAGASVTSSENVIDSVVVDIDGTEYAADVTTSTLVAGHGHPVYTVDLTDEDVTFSGGDVPEFQVYVTFAGLTDNYAENTTLEASITRASILAETASDDSFTISGGTATITGNLITLNTNGAVVSSMRWSVNSTGTMIDFLFTVKAENGDYDVTLASITDNDDINNGDGSGSTVTAPTAISKTSGTATADGTGWTVLEGDTAMFRARYTVAGTNGDWAEVVLTSAAGQAVPEDDQTSPTATYNVN